MFVSTIVVKVEELKNLPKSAFDKKKGEEKYPNMSSRPHEFHP